MEQADYEGRKITARVKKGRHGERFVEVKVNGQFAWTDNHVDLTRSIETTKRYIDDAIERPGAYPVLD
jgi:hypothetical protein